MSWRDRARPIIREVLAANAGKPEAEIKKALHDAYPFGPREYHPYKIWLDEIKRQRKPAVKRGPCGRCGHGEGAHAGRYGAQHRRCHAADCTCEAYSVDHPNQTRLCP